MKSTGDPFSLSSGQLNPSGIPIKDPQAALQFCRWLAANLSQDISENVIGTNQQEPWQKIIYPQPTDGNGEIFALPEISVVIPIYNEEENLSALYERITTVLSQYKSGYEIVFVDDGSRDRSLELLHDFESCDQNVIVVELARNFGHQVAISAGLDHTHGKGVIIMDADMQDPPEVLPNFITKWREGHDVVYAIRERRKEGAFKRMAYSMFYRLLQRIANVRIPLDAGDFCIMDRRVVDVLNGMPERNRFMRGIRSWVGLDQVGLAYERQARHAGETKYTFHRLVYLALDGLVSFSYVPLRMISIIGLSVSILSFIIALFYLLKKLTSGLNPPGFATLVVSVFFLAGIQLITIGVIGEYVGRIFEEVKQRPLYVLRRATRSRSKSKGN